MRLPRDLSGASLAAALESLGYHVTRQKGSHIRLTTLENGEHHLTIPNHDPLRLGTLSGILGREAAVKATAGAARAWCSPCTEASKSSRPMLETGIPTSAQTGPEFAHLPGHWRLGMAAVTGCGCQSPAARRATLRRCPNRHGPTRTRPSRWGARVLVRAAVV